MRSATLKTQRPAPYSSQGQCIECCQKLVLYFQGEVLGLRTHFCEENWSWVFPHRHLSVQRDALLDSLSFPNSGYHQSCLGSVVAVLSLPRSFCLLVRGRRSLFQEKNNPINLYFCPLMWQPRILSDFLASHWVVGTFFFHLRPALARSNFRTEASSCTEICIALILNITEHLNSHQRLKEVFVVATPNGTFVAVVRVSAIPSKNPQKSCSAADRGSCSSE